MSAIIYSDDGLSTVRRQDNQCGLAVNWTPGNTFEWHLNRNTTIFILENFFENVIWEMAALLPRPQCVTAKSSPDIWQFGSKRVDIYRIPSDCLLTIFSRSEHSAHEHYCDVIMGAMASQIPASRLFTQPLFRRRLKKTSKFRVTGIFAGNSPVIGEFPVQMASNAENVSIWWRHHAIPYIPYRLFNPILHHQNLMSANWRRRWSLIRLALCQNMVSKQCSYCIFEKKMAWSRLVWKHQFETTATSPRGQWVNIKADHSPSTPRWSIQGVCQMAHVDIRRGYSCQYWLDI